MIETLRAAMVIARRDYVASVWSKSFLLFLLGPLLPGVAGAFFGGVGQRIEAEGGAPRIAVVLPPAEGRALLAARTSLAERRAGLPDLTLVARPEPPSALLADGGLRAVAVLAGGIDRPRLIAPRAVLDMVRGDIGLILDRARADRALAAAGVAAPATVTIVEQPVAQAAASDAQGRLTTARGGQLVLMLLTMILSGMLLSNLVEEKSSKVIEVLAAAVPVDAIFFGKLLGMLAMSLTGIAIWAGGVVAALQLLAPGLAAALPVPAVGWPLFGLLGLLYFASVYLLVGGLFLGIGAQAASVREVQTLSLPVTMAQLGVVGFAASVVDRLDTGVGVAAAIFPWSSPFTMIARAAVTPALWPHLAALLWQMLWIAIVIAVTAQLFRRSVLKSGRPWWRRRGA